MVNYDMSDEPKSGPSIFSARTQTVVEDSQLPSMIFDTKNILIFILLIVLILSILGINLFWLLGNITENIVNILGPISQNFWNVFGHTSGTVINDTSDIVSIVSKTGIDIADGAIHDVGNILKNSINTSSDPVLIPRIPIPASSSNPITTPVASSKSNWCLVGEHKGTRGCLEIVEGDKCMSNQLFPNQQMCLNPTLTQT